MLGGGGGHVLCGSVDFCLCCTKQTKAFALHEVPIYVRAGAVVPTIPLLDGDTIGVASRQYVVCSFHVPLRTVTANQRVA